MKDTYTIPELIKIIPMEDEVKAQLATEYESFSDGRKFEIQQILWDALFEMTDALTDLKYDELLQDVQEGKRIVSGDMYQEARSMVYQEYEDILNGKKEEVDKIDKIRDQLKGMMGDVTEQ
jgi:hypothetical protein